MLGLSGGVTGDQDHTADRLTVDLGDVVLEETVVTAGPGELELTSSLLKSSDWGRRACVAGRPPALRVTATA